MSAEKDTQQERPIERIEQIAFRFHSEVTHHPQKKGTCVLRRADIGQYTTLSETDWAILSRFNGVKTVSDLVRERLEQGGGFGLLPLLRRIADLRAKGFLIPHSEPVRSDSPLGVWFLGFRIPLPKKVSETKRVWPWAGVLLLSVSLTVGLLTVGRFPKATTQATIFLAIWGSIFVVLSLRSMLALIVLAQAGTWPWRIGMVWAGWVPFFFLDARDVQAAGPKARIALALSEMSTPPLFMGMVYLAHAYWLFSPDLLVGAMVGATMTLWFMLRPFGNGPLMELAKALTGKERIEEDARAYLSRRLWLRIFARGGLFSSEAILIVMALIYPLWGYIGFVLLGQAVTQGFFNALITVLRPTGESLVGAWILLGTLALGIILALGGALLGIIWWMVRMMRGSRLGKTKSPPVNEVDAIMALLAETPFLAMLPHDLLRSIASDTQWIDLPSGAYAIRQGAMGDQFFIIRQGAMVVLHRLESGREERVAELSHGDAFGEMALLVDTPRTASVKAMKPSVLIAISRHAFEQAVLASHLRKEEVTLWIRLSQRLRQFPLFTEMNAMEVAYFLKRAQRRPVPLGTVLIREGDEGSHFYIILSGTFEVSRKGRVVETLSTSDIVGEMALLARVPRTATVTAIESAQVLELSRDAFFEILSVNLSVGCKVITLADQRRKKMS